MRSRNVPLSAIPHIAIPAPNPVHTSAHAPTDAPTDVPTDAPIDAPDHADTMSGVAC
jgi:hypothetical protein